MSRGREIARQAAPLLGFWWFCWPVLLREISLNSQVKVGPPSAAPPDAPGVASQLGRLRRLRPDLRAPGAPGELRQPLFSWVPPICFYVSSKERQSPEAWIEARRRRAPLEGKASTVLEDTQSRRAAQRSANRSLRGWRPREPRETASEQPITASRALRPSLRLPGASERLIACAIRRHP